MNGIGEVVVGWLMINEITDINKYAKKLSSWNNNNAKITMVAETAVWLLSSDNIGYSEVLPVCRNKSIIDRLLITISHLLTWAMSAYKDQLVAVDRAIGYSPLPRGGCTSWPVWRHHVRDGRADTEGQYYVSTVIYTRPRDPRLKNTYLYIVLRAMGSLYLACCCCCCRFCCSWLLQPRPVPHFARSLPRYSAVDRNPWRLMRRLFHFNIDWQLHSS